MNFTLSRQSKLFLLRTARNSIKSVLYEQDEEAQTPPDELKFKSGCFVTIHLRKRLRGCIGNFEDDTDITDNVKQMAVQAAFADPRFGPVSRDEFAMCELEISVLSPMYRADTESIKVGRDGLYMIRGSRRGVLLPQVATEYGWSVTEFLEHTCEKAGLDKDAYKDKDTQIFRFEALVFSEDNLYHTED